MWDGLVPYRPSVQPRRACTSLLRRRLFLSASFANRHFVAGEIRTESTSVCSSTGWRPGPLLRTIGGSELLYPQQVAISLQKYTARSTLFNRGLMYRIQVNSETLRMASRVIQSDC